jgi:hypothetical protein
MANDKDWQLRSDEWVNSTHRSRLKKERELIERTAQLIKQDVAIDNIESSEIDEKTLNVSHKRVNGSNITSKSLKKRKKK